MWFRIYHLKIMVLWHTEFLKLRILKNQQKQEGHSDHNPQSSKPFSPEAGFQHPPVRDALPVYRGKEHPYFQRQSMPTRIQRKHVLLSFFPFTTITSYSLIYSYSSISVHSSSNLAQTYIGLNPFFRSFPYSCVM